MLRRFCFPLLATAALLVSACNSLTAPPSTESAGPDPAQVAAPADQKPAPESAPINPKLAKRFAAGAEAKAAEGKADGKLESVDLVVGKGKEAKPGMHLAVHYVGKLTDGTEFDASRPRGKPFEFDLGKGDVIRGWDQGLVGMRVGGKRKLTIPGSLAYGAAGSPPKIGPNATLVFEIELMDIPGTPR